MTREEISSALDAGETVEAVFWRGALQSLVKIWKHRGSFVLTWEEAPDGAQYDETRYTKDIRRVFSSPDIAYAFLDEHGIADEPFEIAK